MLSVMILIIVVILAHKVAPQEEKEDEHLHGAGQIGLLVTLALIGVDYFTSYYYVEGLSSY
jgi:multisubunit Na+/H+ antiporter MnhB subunit